jgi:kynurenine formamidase
MYNGVPASQVTSAGALANSVESAAGGVVGRGVLLDVPRALGRPWLEPGEAIDVADLEAAEAAQHVRVEEGDVLLVRTGRRRGMADVADWDVSRIAGLHPGTAPWLHERGIAVLGCDGVSDIMPAIVEDGTMPMHTLCLPGMGVLLIDNCALDGVAETCERLGRWEFLFMMAPRRLSGGTSSPVNPLVVF